MKEDRDHRSSFEERLLEELRTVVARRGAEQEAASEGSAPARVWRRAPRLGVAALAAIAVAAAVLAFNSGSDNTSRAFAVEPQDGGGVTIEVYSAEDAPGLEAALREAGIRSQVTWLGAGMACREPHFTPSEARTSMGGSLGAITMGGPGQAITIGVMSADQLRERWREYRRGEISAAEYHESTPNLSLDPAELRPDQTVVISGSPGPYDGDPEGGYEARLAIAEGPVEPCEPVRAPDGGPLGAINAS